VWREGGGRAGGCRSGRGRRTAAAAAAAAPPAARRWAALLAGCAIVPAGARQNTTQPACQRRRGGRQSTTQPAGARRRAPHLHAHVAGLHVLAELVAVAQALAEELDAQADVVAGLLLRAADLVEAVPGDLHALLLEALDLAAIASLHIGAQVLDLLPARGEELRVRAVVLDRLRRAAGGGRG
jgi:hypothetical protein